MWEVPKWLPLELRRDARGVDGTRIADGACGQTARRGGHNGAHHGQRGVDGAHYEAVGRVLEAGIVEAFGAGGHGYLVEIAKKSVNHGRCLQLFLSHNPGQLLFESLVGDLYHGELLPVVARGRVADAVAYESGVVGAEGHALVAPYAAAFEQGTLYAQRGFVVVFHEFTTRPAALLFG